MTEGSSSERRSSAGRCRALGAATAPASSHREGTDVSMHRLLRASLYALAAAGNLLLHPRAAPWPALPPSPASRGRSVLRSGTSPHSWDVAKPHAHMHTLEDKKPELRTTELGRGWLKASERQAAAGEAGRVRGCQGQRCPHRPAGRARSQLIVRHSTGATMPAALWGDGGGSWGGGDRHRRSQGSNS